MSPRACRRCPELKSMFGTSNARAHQRERTDCVVRGCSKGREAGCLMSKLVTPCPSHASQISFLCHHATVLTCDAPLPEVTLAPDLAASDCPTSGDGPKMEVSQHMLLTCPKSLTSSVPETMTMRFHCSCGARGRSAR
jgi:hypothetical protein